MACEIYKKVWVDVAPHERKVWKCMDFIERKPVNRPKKAKTPKTAKPDKKTKPAKKTAEKQAKEKLIVKMPFKKGPPTVEVKALPVKQEPIKYAEDYQLQEPS